VVLKKIRTTARNSDDGGDKDPTKKKFVKFHTICTSSKIKRITKKSGQDVPKIQESPKAMEVDVVIQEPSWLEEILM